MNEIFDQVNKNRKQIFKPAERPCDDFKKLQYHFANHLIRHKKNWRRWKIAGICVAGIVFVTGLVLAGVAMAAMLMANGAK